MKFQNYIFALIVTMAGGNSVDAAENLTLQSVLSKRNFAGGLTEQANLNSALHFKVVLSQSSSIPAHVTTNSSRGMCRTDVWVPLADASIQILDEEEAKPIVQVKQPFVLRAVATNNAEPDGTCLPLESGTELQFYLQDTLLNPLEFKLSNSKNNFKFEVFPRGTDLQVPARVIEKKIGGYSVGWQLVDFDLRELIAAHRRASTLSEGPNPFPRPAFDFSVRIAEGLLAKGSFAFID